MTPLPGEPESAGFSTFYLFATSLSVGLTAVLPLVPIRAMGRRFFILMTLIAVVFYALAMGARGVGIAYFHAACAGCLILFNVSVSERGGPFSAAILLAALGSGIAGLISDAVAYPVEIPLGVAPALWISASFITSALVLGGSLGAMILGHWYLVVHDLSFRVLRLVTAALLAALAVRLLVIGLASLLQGDHWARIWADAGGAVGFFTSPGVFVGARALFGLVLPLILTCMVWQCVKLRSNQSATGILYVVVVFVLIGEVIAKHLLVENRLLI